jgi:hypothetical protein
MGTNGEAYVTSIAVSTEEGLAAIGAGGVAAAGNAYVQSLMQGQSHTGSSVEQPVLRMPTIAGGGSVIDKAGLAGNN